jgi:3-oxoacyl-[acyl-carrier protein] reductase
MAPTALITGASGGIGAATARDLGRDHDVLVHYHSNREAAEAVAADLAAGDTGAVVHGCDVSDPDAVASMVDRATDEFGGVDVLVNNAAVFHQTALTEASTEEIQRTLRVNLEGAVYCVREVLPGMVDRGAGRIVNVSSTAGVHGSPTDPAYGASKGGLLGLTRSLAKRYTGEGIFTNAVAPGPTDTPMFAQERRPATRERSPIDRLVAPEEIAEAIRAFATTAATTGQVLTIDGGISTA